MDSSPGEFELASLLSTIAKTTGDDSTTHPQAEPRKDNMRPHLADNATDRKERRIQILQSPDTCEAPQGPANRSRTCVRWLHWWGWELGACFGSLAAFIAMFALLMTYNNKTQPNWPYRITLNSAVSWLTAIMKGMLLVPAAACISQSTWIYYESKSYGTSKGHSLKALTTYDSASRGPWGSVQLLWALRGR
jgi:hypothetical protein